MAAWHSNATLWLFSPATLGPSREVQLPVRRSEPVGRAQTRRQLCGWPGDDAGIGMR